MVHHSAFNPKTQGLKTSAPDAAQLRRMPVSLYSLFLYEILRSEPTCHIEKRLYLLRHGPLSSHEFEATMYVEGLGRVPHDAESEPPRYGERRMPSLPIAPRPRRLGRMRN